MASDEQLRAIVQRMVERGDSREAIAEVVRNYDAQQQPSSLEDRVHARYPYIKKMEEGALSGGVATAAPAAIGQIARTMAPGATAALKAGAERLYGGLLKAKDATLERFPTVVRDLMAAGAPISQGGRRRVIEGLRRVGDEKQALLTAADERAMVPREAMRRGLDDVLDTAIQTSDTPVKDMEKLAKIERDLIPDAPGVTPSHADRMKSKMQAESDRAFRQMKMGTRVTETGARARTGIATSTKEALEAIEPRLKDVNARYGSGKGQAEALRDAVKRADKHNVVGMGDLLGGTLGATTAGPIGIPAGVAMMRLLSNPNAGSRIAIGMDRLANIPQLDRASQMALLALLAERSNDQ